jgi:hypothetical protein
VSSEDVFLTNGSCCEIAINKKNFDAIKPENLEIPEAQDW